MPSIKVGFEYQGQQHYESVEFFGGQAALEHRMENDALKKKKCKQNGVVLVEWIYTEQISIQRKPSPEQAKKELAKQLWLSYYNQVLFEAGLITETERNRMKNKISALAPSASNGVDRSVLT